MRRGVRNAWLAAASALALAACQATAPRPGASEPIERETFSLHPPPAPKPLAPPPLVLREVEPEPLTGGEILDRLQARLSAPSCVRGNHNRRWRSRYAASPDRFAQQVAEILPLLDYVLEEVEQADLPGEFALIPIVESWFRPDATGHGGRQAPGGMWQMIPSTARNHGVAIAGEYDGRYSPVDATRAAVSYLDALHDEFGDWRATAMAYNAGEGRMRRALAAGDGGVHGERRRPAGLAQHTYAYIDKLRALSCLLSEPERHGLTLPRDVVVDPLRRVTIPPGEPIDVVAEALETDPSLLADLNPAYANGRVGTAAPHVLLVPEETRQNWPALSQLESDSRGEVAAPQGGTGRDGAYTVRRGDTLSAIAQRHGLRLTDLLHWNGLGRSSVLHPGQTLRLSPQ